MSMSSILLGASAFAGFVGLRSVASGHAIWRENFPADLFTFVKKLGAGAFGDVHRVIEKRQAH